jgi:hypothetical protein
LKEYLIIENNVPVGFFSDELDRDNAFKDFLDSKKNGYKKNRVMKN